MLYAVCSFAKIMREKLEEKQKMIKQERVEELRQLTRR